MSVSNLMRSANNGQHKRGALPTKRLFKVSGHYRGATMFDWLVEARSAEDARVQAATILKALRLVLRPAASDDVFR